jgi:hypothetical protein
VRKLSHSIDLRFDLTSDQRYSLDPLTEQLVRDLESPLEVTYVWGIDDDLRSRVLDPMGRVREDLLAKYYYPILHNVFVRLHEVLTEWQSISPNLRVRILRDEEDPLAADGLARSLGIERKELLNHVHFRMGNRTRRIPLNNLLEGMDWGSFPPMGIENPPRGPTAFRVHEELTAALRQVCSSTSARILIPKGLGTRFDAGTEDVHELENILLGEGYELVPTDLRPKEELSVEGTALILSQPRGALDPNILEVILNYEGRGGRILLLLDPEKPTTFERLLEIYGIESKPGRIQDRVHTRPGVGDSLLFSDELMVGRHPIDAPLKNRVTVFLGGTRPLVVSGERATGAERTSLLRGSKQALFLPATFDQRTGAVTLRPELLEPMPDPSLAVACERRLPSSASTRLVVFGSTDLATSQALRTGRIYGNRDLILNSVAWFLDRKSSIRLSPRGELIRRMMDPRHLQGPVLWLGIIGLPFLAAVGSLVMFLRRRN